MANVIFKDQQIEKNSYSSTVDKCEYKTTVSTTAIDEDGYELGLKPGTIEYTESSGSSIRNILQYRLNGQGDWNQFANDFNCKYDQVLLDHQNNIIQYFIEIQLIGNKQEYQWKYGKAKEIIKEYDVASGPFFLGSKSTEKIINGLTYYRRDVTFFKDNDQDLVQVKWKRDSFWEETHQYYSRTEKAFMSFAYAVATGADGYSEDWLGNASLQVPRTYTYQFQTTELQQTNLLSNMVLYTTNLFFFPAPAKFKFNYKLTDNQYKWDIKKGINSLITNIEDFPIYMKQYVSWVLQDPNEALNLPDSLFNSQNQLSAEKINKFAPVLNCQPNETTVSKSLFDNLELNFSDL